MEEKIVVLTPERHHIILELLRRKHSVKIQEFAEKTNSSESTIRRDLSQLEKEKKLKRVHGGASIVQQKAQELSILEKSMINTNEKNIIAKYAANLINNGDCIYLDAGTTSYQMIPYIVSKKIKVVTNGFTHLDALLEKEIETYIIGGYVKNKTRALIGSGAIDSLSRYRFDKCFIGVNGIHLDYGYTTPDPEEAKVKRTAMNLAQETYVLADDSKFNEVAFAQISDLKQATIITNQVEQEILDDFLKQTKIKVVTS